MLVNQALAVVVRETLDASVRSELEFYKKAYSRLQATGKSYCKDCDTIFSKDSNICDNCGHLCRDRYWACSYCHKNHCRTCNPVGQCVICRWSVCSAQQRVMACGCIVCLCCSCNGSHKCQCCSSTMCKGSHSCGLCKNVVCSDCNFGGECRACSSEQCGLCRQLMRGQRHECKICRKKLHLDCAQKYPLPICQTCLQDFRK